MPRVICIDPGLDKNGGTGCAFWPFLKHKTAISAATVPRKVILIQSKTKDWLERTGSIANQFQAFIKDMRADHVVIEGQELWGGSAKSHASASTGALFKLTILTGRLIQIASDAGAITEILQPSKWKGQLSKEAVDERIKRELNKSYPNHISDAVGMGLHLQGKL